ncbi:MAG: hypothetical protein AABY68_04505 [Pseudomonadota bacterium]
MAKKLSLLDSGWLMMETRETPMHVAGLQLRCRDTIPGVQRMLDHLETALAELESLA